jgi:hypothetical protein
MIVSDRLKQPGALLLVVTAFLVAAWRVHEFRRGELPYVEREATEAARDREFHRSLDRRDAAVERIEALGGTFPYRSGCKIECYGIIDLTDWRGTDDDLALLNDLVVCWPGNPIRDEAPANLLARGSPLSDKSVPYLAVLSSLQEIDIRETQITDEGARRLQEALPNCRILR